MGRGIGRARQRPNPQPNRPVLHTQMMLIGAWNLMVCPILIVCVHVVCLWGGGWVSPGRPLTSRTRTTARLCHQHRFLVPARVANLTPIRSSTLIVPRDACLTPGPQVKASTQSPIWDGDICAFISTLPVIVSIIWSSRNPRTVTINLKCAV